MKHDEAVHLTIQLASAHLTGTPTPAEQLPALLRRIHAAVMELADPDHEPRPADGSPPPHPAAAPGLSPEERVELSITHEHVFCLECGEAVRLLKPHVQNAHRMTVPAYINKWGLPPDYPLYPPAYLEKKRKLAGDQGLGTHVVASNRQPKQPMAFGDGESDLKKSLKPGKPVAITVTATGEKRGRGRPRKTA